MFFGARPRVSSLRLRTDNDPQFLSEAFVQWANSRGMAIQYIHTGKPSQIAYIEGFNRTCGEEVWTSA